MANPSPEHKDLYNRVSQIIEAARGQVARTVNTAMVHAYWLIGREIVEVQQQGQLRAGYGDELIKRLATELTRQFGKGFTTTSLKRMRQFYRTFPEGSRVPPDLGGPKPGGCTPELHEPLSFLHLEEVRSPDSAVLLAQGRLVRL